MASGSGVLLTDIGLWIDPIARPGPECMAVDEWLLEHSDLPVLRVYRWLGAWGTIGYFGDLDAAKAAFPGVEWVRRWTGGGTVDHRADWAYTLVIPKAHALATLRGSESYCVIHRALAGVLREERMQAALSDGTSQTGASACFQNPVCHDVVDSQGAKLAGAGQRRSRLGLLHQGSVALPCDEAVSSQRAERLAAALSTHWQHLSIDPPQEEIQHRVAQRYGTSAWNERRR